MAVTIVASLVSASSPQPVQVVVNGMTVGQSWSVVGTTVDGSTWPVPGGSGVADGGQVVLVDNRSSLNTPVSYQLTVGGQVYASNTVTVAFPDAYLIQSLDGQTVVRFVLLANGLPNDPVVASTAFDVPGRSRPPVRFVAGGDGGGSLEIRTTAGNSERMRELLRSGRPVVVRTDGAVRDFPAVEIVLPTAAPNRLWDVVEGDAMSTERVWSLAYLLVDDPEPSTALSAFTWDDFDAAMATRTWSVGSSSFDALFTGLTWNDLDKYDWDQL